MKINRCFLYVSILICLFQSVYPQDVLDEKINISYVNFTIENILDSLHSKYSIDFSYDPSRFPVDSVICITENNTSIENALHKIFSKNDLQLQSIGRQIIITAYKRDVAVKNYITVSGLVTSHNGDGNLPYVNISIVGQPIGTTTNGEGEFKFLIPRKYLGEQIHMSSIGYSPKRISVPNNDTVIHVSLESETIHIKEVKVQFFKSDEIIDKVIANIKQNYFTSPMLLTAFFRETIKQDGKYIEVSEAVLDIYKSSYLKSNDMEKTKFVKGRKKVEDNEIAVARLKLAGGPALFSGVDVAKHLNFISSRAGSEISYFYVNKGKDVVYDRVVYKIGFKPIAETEQETVYYKGDLYIDIEDFALLRADFRMTKRTLKNSGKILIQKHAKKIKSVPINASYRVDYRPYNKKWILNSVQGELEIEMYDKRKKTKSEYHAKAEMLITNASEGKGKRIKYSESFKTNYILADQIVSYDPLFWENYNVIQPEDELEKVLKSTPVEINVVPLLRKTKP